MVGAGSGLQFLQSGLMTQAFGAYVAVMIRVVALRPVPFIASFTGYLAGLYLMEALYLRHLFRQKLFR